MAPGWGWRSRAGWSRRTPAASCWKTAHRARRRFAVRSTNRSWFCDGGGLVLTENVHIDIVEHPNQGCGCVPDAPGTTSPPEHDLSAERLANVHGERGRHVAAIEADELTAQPVDQGSILAQPAALGLAEPGRTDADNGDLGGVTRRKARDPLDAHGHPRPRRNARNQPRSRFPRLLDLPLPHVRHQAPVRVVGKDAKSHLPKRRQNLGTELRL